MTYLDHRSHHFESPPELTMSKNKAPVPDAWEDDWEAQADKVVNEPEQSAPQAPLTKAERLAQHAEQNRKLWESAYVPSALRLTC